MTYSAEVLRRLRELDEKGPAGRDLFEHYVRAVAAGRSSSNARPASLSNRALFTGYDDASADYHRYGEHGTLPYGSPGSECNLAIVTLAGERMTSLRKEMLRRMKR